jgi:hypothetical protein
MSDDRFEHELRAVLAEGVPAEAPEPVRARLLAVGSAIPVAGSGRDPVARRTFGRLGPIFAVLGSFAVVGVAIAVIVALAGGRPTQVGGPGGTSAGGPGGSAAGAEVVWDSGIVQLTAMEVELVAGGREFLVGPQRFAIHSDPGHEAYQTLEVEWQESGREMRVYFYFSADGQVWTLDELRTYDGQDPADWITYPGPLLRAPLGRPFTGGFERADPRAQGSIRFEGLSLFPFRQAAVRADGLRAGGTAAA